MKIFILVLLLGSTRCFSQTPAQFNYQGVAKNNSGVPLANQSISLRFTIRNGSPAGTINYQETRNVATNQNGLFTVVIGSSGAANVTGTVAAINWTNSNTKYLQVEMDAAGGTNFTDLGTTQLVSVPFAEQARSAAGLKVSAFITDNVVLNTINVNGGETKTVPYNSTSGDANFDNASSEYTIPVTGNYFVSYNAGISIFSSGGKGRGSIALYKNSSYIQANDFGRFTNSDAVGQIFPFSGTYVGAFTAGQKVTVKISNTGNSTDPLNAFMVLPVRLLIYKIGE